MKPQRAEPLLQKRPWNGIFTAALSLGLLAGLSPWLGSAGTSHSEKSWCSSSLLPRPGREPDGLLRFDKESGSVIALQRTDSPRCGKTIRWVTSIQMLNYLCWCVRSAGKGVELGLKSPCKLVGTEEKLC